MRIKLLVAAAGLVAFATPSLAAEFYIVQDSSTKRCSIVEERPTATTATAREIVPEMYSALRLKKSFVLHHVLCAPERSSAERRKPVQAGSDGRFRAFSL